MIEYLLLIAGAVILASMVVTIMIGIPQISSGGSSQKAQTSANEFNKYKTLGQVRGGYRFEGNLQDSSGSSYSVLVLPAVYSFSAGKIGSSISLSSPYLQFPTQVINGLADFTFMAWVKTRDNWVASIISSGPELNIYFTELSGTLSVEGFAWDAPIQGNGAASADHWNHIAFTKNGTEVKIYLNCQPIETGTVSPNQSMGASVTTMNISHSTINFDETYILNRALSQQEIKALAGC